MIQKLASLRIGELNLITQYLNITCNLYGCHLFSRIDNITIFPSAGYYTGLYNFMRLAFFIIMANETSKINFHYTILQFIFFSVVVLPTWASCSKDSRITQVITVCTLATTSCSFVAMKLHTWTYSGAEVFNVHAMQQFFDVFSGHKQPDHACQNALALCVQPTLFGVWAWPSINSRSSLYIIELTANPHQLPYFLE